MFHATSNFPKIILKSQGRREIERGKRDKKREGQVKYHVVGDRNG
jgi:hypothetical protein